MTGRKWAVSWKAAAKHYYMLWRTYFAASIKHADRAKRTEEQLAHTKETLSLLQQQYEQALSAGRRALELGPHDAQTYFYAGTIFRYVRQYDSALYALKRAVRLNPVTPPHYLNALGWTYLLTEQPEKALAVFGRLLARNPDHLFADLGRITAHWLAGRQELAQHQAARLRRYYPHFRLAEWANSEPYQNPETIQPLVAALRHSGLP